MEELNIEQIDEVSGAKGLAYWIGYLVGNTADFHEQRLDAEAGVYTVGL